MLRPPAPFPQAGSYGLLIDGDRPYPQPAELVRIIRIGHPGYAVPGGDQPEVLLSFPLRAGAGGNKTVLLNELIDATDLTPAEARELADLQRELRGREARSARLKRMADRLAVLRTRAIWAPVLARQLQRLAPPSRRVA